MKHHCLRHVCGNEVIISALGSWNLILRCLGRLVLEAQDGLDIFLSLGYSKVAPV